MVHYANPVMSGLDKVTSLGDGYTINMAWFQAYPDNVANKIAYHLYYSTAKDKVFSEGVKFVVVDGTTSANIIDLTPGQDYWFSMRPLEYNVSFSSYLSNLPIAHDNVRFYPSSILRFDISASSLIIPLLDVDGFSAPGIIKVGVELIQYLAVDTVNKNLIVPSVNGRGFNFTPVTMHTVSGSDGYNAWSPIISGFVIEEDNGWDNIYACQSRFEYPHFPFTLIDGYHQVVKDVLSTDLSGADAANITFPPYDFSGYHRTDPVQLLNGTCVGSYIGGEMGCIDSNGNFNIYRGFSLQDQNTQRQDLLLSMTGRPAVLIRRVQTGITCSCYLTSSEYPDDRCPFCYGTKFVFGYEQYFNPRMSDGRIQIRTGPTEENLKMYEAGMESEYPLDVWSLTVPTIKTRDVLVLFDQNDNEEFRYEVAGVTRNNTINGLDGGQHLKTFRIRKFDPAYQIRIFRNTSDFPSKLNTSLGFAVGLPPHSHEIVINEKVLSVSQINQTTAISQGHNHPIVNGQVMEVLGHTHTIILP
jgi:hypothetical protein